ncbi:hypothetical protein CEUSTIGMA_g253.t1 [Chlamydomonas eustigma]|uniref:Uncharacterized protein n=1 Tax=Chlamydomonas eustigma TaxID=1157962 RepID=A0A250WPP0_9CHLO|nr:hypothetical protein CEUSTIGMA_g253.t1 [Chlamydomonas eustigma]|eukprot:GAX72798.1 hypothetical protein CEUSTIGMA_g253.t1 [Chlamydomonas eustigma]
MRLKVNLSPVGSGLSVDDSIDLYCGQGEQILQWVGYASCSRLAYKRGDVYGRYIPQSITTKDGQPLDVDIVINELFGDGDELYVEYSNGPMPFRIRWEGRPRTPPFKWGEAGEELPPHDTWLRELDLVQEGIMSLIDTTVFATNGISEDLEVVKDVLMRNAGAMQMVFYFQSSEGASNGDQLGQITLPQFRGIMIQAKVITTRFPAEKVDEIFTSVVTSEQALARKVESKSGVSTFDLMDFTIAIIHVAAQRYAAMSPAEAGKASMVPLQTKMDELFKNCFDVYLFPELQKRLDRFSAAVSNPAAQLLLKRGRKLVEQTLDSCQLKRVKSSVVKVDLRWLCNHLQRWNLLNKDFNLQELALIAVFAKQTSTDPHRFILHPHPLDYNYSEFERLLLGMAWHIYVTKKKGEAFEEYLGEMLDTIFKKAGILVEVVKDKQDVDE